MASESAANLRQCIIDLSRADTSGDYQKALQAANRMLRRFPKETYAYKCKLIALIQLGQYDDALTLIKKTLPNQMGDVGFEKSYILYRLGKNEEALEILALCKEGDYRVKELQAQIFYKLEKFQEAYDIFLVLLKNHSDEYDEERKANYLAVQAQLESMGVKQQMDGGWETFEQLYNAACQQIEAEQWKDALQSLDRALALCRETLSEEGLSPEEIEDELSMIRVQRAFVLQRTGKRTEALEIYKTTQAAGVSDLSVKVTVENNLMGALDDVKVQDSRKKLKSALQMDQTKLSGRQRRTLMLNNALALLLSNQREPCRRALDELSARYGSSKDAKLIEAALLVKMNDIEKASQLLDNDDVDAELTRAHILINSGRVTEALTVLARLPSEIRSRPAASSLVVSCLVAADKKDEAIKALESALKSVKSVGERRALLEEAAQLESGRGNIKAAAGYLEQMAKLVPDDVTIQCRLIRAYSEFDAKKAEELSAQVFPDSGDDNVDVDQLEESDWILYGEKYRLKKEVKMEDEDTQIITRKLKNNKRKRKVRLPKNYDPNVAPDPERWLPRQERAAYKKKVNRRNRHQNIGRGTQGSASVNPNVEYTAASPNSPRPLAGPAADGPRLQRPKQQMQKNKKKKKSTF